MTIWKFRLAVSDYQLIMMPVGAEILYIQTQHGIPNLWAKVNPENLKEGRAFYTYGTGHEMSNGGSYVGTYQLSDRALVFHVFEAQ